MADVLKKPVKDDDLLANPIKPDADATPEQRKAAQEAKEEDKMDAQSRRALGQLLYWEWVQNILNPNFSGTTPQNETASKQSIQRSIERFEGQFSSYTNTDSANDAADLARDGVTQSDPASYFNYLDRRAGIESGGRSGGGRFDPGSVKMSAAEIGERQKIVVATLPEAAAQAGVNINILQGMWGVESRFGKALSAGSLSSARGDWQFLSGTGNYMTRKYGHEVEGAQGRDWRMDPRVSTHMAARYIRELADGLGVDPMDERNAGLLYAAYNIGPGGVRRLLRLAEENPDVAAASRLGKLASNNPMFYKGGATAGEALGRYQQYVMAREDDYEVIFGNGGGPRRGQTRVAQRDDDGPARQVARGPQRTQEAGFIQTAMDTGKRLWNSLPDLNPFS